MRVLAFEQFSAEIADANYQMNGASPEQPMLLDVFAPWGTLWVN